MFFGLAFIGAVAVFFLWRPKPEAKRLIKTARLASIAILLFVAFIPLFLYFLLGGNPILAIQSDRLSFEGSETRYYQHNENIYRAEQIGLAVRRIYLSEVDVDSFELGGIHWGKDKNRVYYYDSVIEGADPETFKFVEPRIGVDSNAVFIMVKNWGGKRFIQVPELEVESFEQLGEFYFKDSNTVIYRDEMEDSGYRILLEADALSFELISGEGSRYEVQVARDKDHVWIDGELQRGIAPD